MKKVFLRRPFYRLLTPLISGTVAYVLILLFNNNVTQLQEAFLGAELYFCLGLALLVQEAILACLWPTSKLEFSETMVWHLATYSLLALVVSISLVLGVVYGYYTNKLGYQPAWIELLMFGGIFGFISVLLISLHISYQLLSVNNKAQMADEEKRKAHVAADFHQFKRGINPELLLESLETLIVFLHQDKNLADDVIDHLATVYRYILAGRKKELVPLEEELEVLKDLLQLFNHLPYRRVAWSSRDLTAGYVVPGTLLSLVQAVIRSSIVITKQDLSLQLTVANNKLILTYPSLERIRQPLGISQLQPIVDSYTVYSTEPVNITEDQDYKTITIPLIEI